MGLQFEQDFGTNNEVFKKAIKLREKVFITERGSIRNNDIDDYDDKGYHFIATHNNELVCCARVILKNDKLYWGRIAVEKEYRSQKIGAVVLEKLKEFSKDVLKQEIVYINAVYNVKDFYTKFGFIEFNDIFVEDGVNHIAMKLKM
ncbi:ElaA protein [Spiroplasma corruscae]|uniref:ElaA protein n=1 Tax=Spiroplasma corruscae TaxID=216934 RepID=A0A222EQG2_9MOLU|nr:GNAT family N-acetyltransferase [Spiroplasma corruscae]ASP28760.1 ElaA protein [Spiroplasma corruscae]